MANLTHKKQTNLRPQGPTKNLQVPASPDQVGKALHLFDPCGTAAFQFLKAWNSIMRAWATVPTRIIKGILRSVNTICTGTSCASKSHRDRLGKQRTVAGIQACRRYESVPGQNHTDMSKRDIVVAHVVETRAPNECGRHRRRNCTSSKVCG